MKNENTLKIYSSPQRTNGLDSPKTGKLALLLNFLILLSETSSNYISTKF